MPVLCEGCGGALPARAGTAGRPATYHGATCRQRARRARLAAEPDRAALLARLDDVGQALSAARHAVTANQDARAALEQLRALVIAVTPERSALAPGSHTSTVTKHVTESTDCDVIIDPSPRAVTPADKVDPNTVKVLRSPDFEVSGSYHALATVQGETVLLGILRRSDRTGWVALTPLLIAVSGGPWRTRQDALVQLILNHDLARTNARERARS
ncbi:hypothetical protein [Kibdelosporangium philippinense]|uniref:hypothetical protein n=1 Tax=Kibdelosporangium philippinense TaxID=211113 RepID=UPI0036106F2A